MYGYVHSIDTFGTVDGPGIRLVVFTQGCPMRCMYCHNPDTWTPKIGNQMSVEEILHEYDKCKEFLKNGGITVTGGEPLLQIDFITDLFKKAKQKNIHTCLDTSGIVFSREECQLKKFDELMKYTDLVMLDIKHIDPEKHKILTKQDNKNILDFAKYISEKNVTLWIRHVVVPGITDDPVYLDKLGVFLADLKTLKALDVLPYHTMGVVKYEKLGIEYPLKDVEPLSKEDAIKARDIILNALKRTRAEQLKNNK